MLILALIALGFFIFSFNLNNPLFWDDDEWIKGNVFVHNFSSIKEIFTQNVLAGFGLNSNYYRPMLLLSFAFNYVIHGIAPFGYHLLSNSIHIANGILVFVLLSSFIGSRASFIAALLFLIHPVQTEAVTYISGRGDPMSVFFMLLALWFFIRSLNLETFKQKYVYSFLSLISAVFGILSRETAILFPLLLMIFYISFLSKDKFPIALKKSFIVSLPFWAISGFYFILRLTVFNFENTLNFYSQSNIYTENLLYRLYTFGAVLIEYFKIIFVPISLHMERDFPVFTSLFQWPVWFSFLVVFAILFSLFFLFKKEKLSQGIRNHESGIREFKNHNSYLILHNSNFRIWFFSWAWFFVALGPVSGIVPINALIYEHWLYLPLIGLAALAGFYIDKIFEYLRINYKSQISIVICILLFGTYISFFFFLSIKRNILCFKPIEFYEDILKYSPESVRILTNLGNLYLMEEDFARAEDLFEKAIESPAGKNFAQPYYNLGNLYRDSGRIDEAISQYRKAIEIDSSFPFAYQNLAVLLINNKRDLVGGAQVLEELKRIQPGNPRVYYNLGLIYLGMDNLEAAVQNLEIGLEIARGRDEEVEMAISEILDQIK